MIFRRSSSVIGSGENSRQLLRLRIASQSSMGTSFLGFRCDVRMSRRVLIPHRSSRPFGSIPFQHMADCLVSAFRCQDLRFLPVGQGSGFRTYERSRAVKSFGLFAREIERRVAIIGEIPWFQHLEFPSLIQITLNFNGVHISQTQVIHCPALAPVIDIHQSGS